MIDEELERRFAVCQESGGLRLDLRTLELGKYSLLHEWAELIKSIVRKFPQLEYLDLSQSDLSDAGLHALVSAAEAGNLPNLRMLDLRSTEITDDGFIPLARAAEAGDLPNLRMLDLRLTKITDDGFIPLARAAEAGLLPNMQAIYLSRTTITDDGFMPLARAAEAGNLPNLERLYLLDTTITDDGFMPLARAAEAGLLPNLESLDLSHTTITDSGIMPLARAAEAGNLPNLELLYLSNSPITDDGFIPLARAAEAGLLPHLLALYLSRTAITDDGFMPLARAAEAGLLPNLEWLDLSRTTITDDGFKPLARAAEAGNLPILDWLNLYDTKISIDAAVLKSGNASQIFEWVRRRSGATPDFPLHEAKLLVVGQGRVGKSELCKRALLPKKSDSDSPPRIPAEGETHDIDMHTVEFERADNGDRITFRLWDFGGQDHLHGTHRFFVGSERALYLLVVNASQTAKLNRLDYWLRFLAHHGRSTEGDEIHRAPVILVHTHCDELAEAKVGLPSPHAAKRILENAADLEAAISTASENKWYGADVVEDINDLGDPKDGDVSSTEVRREIKRRDDLAVNNLRTAIRQHTSKIIGINYLVPPSALKIRNWLKKQFETDLFEASGMEEHKKHFRFDEAPFVEFCLAEGIDKDDKGKTEDPAGNKLLDLRILPALRLFKSLGMIHWINEVKDVARSPDDGVLRRVFNPRWIKRPVYKLIRLPGQDYPHGLVNHDEFDKTLPLTEQRVNAARPTNDRQWFEQLRFTTDDRQHIVDLMVDSQIVFRVTTERKGLLIPDLLLRGDLDWAPATDAVVGEYRSDFLPDRILLQFLAEYMKPILRENGDLSQSTIFRNCAKLARQHEGIDFEVRVQVEVCPPPGERPWLRIAVSGGQQRQRALVLAIVKGKINEIIDAEGLPQLETVSAMAHPNEDDAIELPMPQNVIGRSVLLTASDEQLSKWFASLPLGEWIKHFQVFWYVGRLDQDALMQPGHAMGFGNLAGAFDKMQTANQIDDLPLALNSIKSILKQLQGAIATSIPAEAWADDEQMHDFRTDYFIGRKREHQWTARARKTWLYVDRMLQRAGCSPKWKSEGDVAS